MKQRDQATENASAPSSDDAARSVTNDQTKSDNASLEQLLHNVLTDQTAPGETAPPAAGDSAESAAQAEGEQKSNPSDSDPETGNPPETEGEGAEPAAPEADGEGEDGQEDAGEDEVEDGKPRKWSASVQRKIDKLTKRLRTLETERDSERQRVQELEEQIEQPGAQPPQPARSDGLTNLTADQLQLLEARAEQAQEDIEDYLDGVATDQQQARVAKQMEAEKLDEGGLKRRKRDLQRLIARDIPSRRDYLAKESSSSNQAKDIFPWWKDRSSEEYQQAMRVVQTMPEIRRLPHWKLIASTYCLGLKQLKAVIDAKQAKSGASNAPAALPPPQPRRSTATTKPILNSEAQLAAVRKRAFESGSDEDQQTWIAAELKKVL